MLKITVKMVISFPSTSMSIQDILVTKIGSR
jgi:hypothetical protein